MSDELDPATKARIEAEERYRTQVRAQQQQSNPSSRPSLLPPQKPPRATAPFFCGVWAPFCYSVCFINALRTHLFLLRDYSAGGVDVCGKVE